MNAIRVSAATSSDGATRAPNLTPIEQAVFALLSRHEIPDILVSASGSPSQRLVALVRDLAAFVESHGEDCAAVIRDSVGGLGVAVCSHRPASECGYAWHTNPDYDIGSRNRVLVVGAGADGTDAVFCNQQHADIVITDGRVE